MERRGIKAKADAAGLKDDRPSPEKKFRTVDDYRREAGLPQAENPAIWKAAWAIDKTRSEFDKRPDLLLIKDHAEQAKSLLEQLDQNWDDNRQFRKVFQSMKGLSRNNSYIKEIVDGIEKSKSILLQTTINFIGIK